MLASMLLLGLTTQLCEPAALAPPLPIGSAYPFPGDAVLGVRDDPLRSYDDLAATLYPFGIAESERGVALQLLREARLQQVYGISPTSGLPPQEMALPPALPTPPAALPPAVPLSLTPLSPRGLTTDAVRVTLDLGGAASGSLTIVLVGTERDLVPLPLDAVADVGGRPRELARFTRAFQGGGGTFDLRLPAAPLDVADAADAFAVIRVAGVGTASGYAGTIPLRTIAPTHAARLGSGGTITRSDFIGTQPRRRTGSVVLSSVRPIRQSVRP